ncbi:isopentenyl-diphosphate Delta-isomerase [Rhodococcus sp. G-MC3]|uniref:isopentenyl-diphosphate Delta-isomerase n=1 Tax=Rhodococcus sp. G-MC3 TaxID=3046209 RepID=UPI0024BA8948|nr:isopentenyl-diphosphate Delta-isomerase [Rhodococcus sp. G-MC3]MDJ0392877.1 isopentenyl-diphosphate Delta-isomerase [Rhodococcus sp. G-MC3]
MSSTSPVVTEYVVLVDDAGHSVGTALKSIVHTTSTPLHLAFSCYVFNSHGDVLITERAHHKKTWPSVTTNTCCGHPGPGEDLSDAVVRRLEQELGIAATSVRLLLPDFRYRAVMDDGVVENELCPVYGVLYDGPAPRPDPAEVARANWIPWSEFSQFVSDGGTVSPWCREQMPLLRGLGDDPSQWPSGSSADLPEAARSVGDLD